jgi:hypothetical protein
MTFADVHMAIRNLLRGAGNTSFHLSVEAHECHPNRVTVNWRVWLEREPPRQSLSFRSTEPEQLIEFVRRSAAESLQPPPREVAAIGEIPGSIES